MRSTFEEWECFPFVALKKKKNRRRTLFKFVFHGSFGWRDSTKQKAIQLFCSFALFCILSADAMAQFIFSFPFLSFLKRKEKQTTWSRQRLSNFVPHRRWIRTKNKQKDVSTMQESLLFPSSVHRWANTFGGFFCCCFIHLLSLNHFFTLLTPIVMPMTLSSSVRAFNYFVHNKF